jgi:hypothetical protein
MNMPVVNEHPLEHLNSEMGWYRHVAVVLSG